MDRTKRLTGLDEFEAFKLNELDRLLNDPDVPMRPGRVWELATELSQPPAEWL